MLDQKDVKKIEDEVQNFFTKMTIEVQKIEIKNSSIDNKNELSGEDKINDVVFVEVKIDEPQILIGEKGQTLFEIQRLLKTVLNRKIQKLFYLNLDINDYKKKKEDFLRELARDLADEVAFKKEERVLSPMSAYERRAIHAELAGREDVITESRGEGYDRRVVIKPKN
jgi:spoIIIJ-associated protein